MTHAADQDGNTSSTASGCSCTGAKACPVVSLCQMKPGDSGVIAEAQLVGEDASLLRAMGLAPGCKVVMCRGGEPCIVAVVSGRGEAGACCASRIGLARPLAEKIMVTPNA